MLKIVQKQAQVSAKTPFFAKVFGKNILKIIGPWWRALAVSSPPATMEIGAMVREIESRQGDWFKKSVLGAPRNGLTVNKMTGQWPSGSLIKHK
jgi:hypothetical protein